MDRVARARMQDEAVMREVRRWYNEGCLFEVQAIVEANPDLEERITNAIEQWDAEIGLEGYKCHLLP